MKNIFILLLSLYAYCAHSQSKEVLDKIETRKIAHITKELDLTPEQAEKFWPIYREFSKQRRAINQEFVRARKGIDPNTASDEEMKRLVDLGLQVKEKQLGLERQYSDRIREVISNRQMLNLREAEDEFRQMLLRRVQQRRRQQNETQQNRQRNGAMRDQRRNN